MRWIKTALRRIDARTAQRRKCPKAVGHAVFGGGKAEIQLLGVFSVTPLSTGAVRGALHRMDHDPTHHESTEMDDDASSVSTGSESTGVATPAMPAREYLLHTAKHTTTGRVIDSIKSPPMHPLAHEKAIDPETGKPNAAKLKKWFKKEGKLHKEDILHIISEASAILRQEPNMLSVSSPITGTLRRDAFKIPILGSFHLQRCTIKFSFDGFT